MDNVTYQLLTKLASGAQEPSLGNKLSGLLDVNGISDQIKDYGGKALDYVKSNPGETAVAGALTGAALLSNGSMLNKLTSAGGGAAGAFGGKQLSDYLVKSYGGNMSDTTKQIISLAGTGLGGLLGYTAGNKLSRNL